MTYPITISLLFCATTFGFPSRAQGQTPMPPPAQVEAMKKLAGWVGDWKGTGWAAMGPGQRQEFTINEKVQRKIGGTVLLIEGLGKSRKEGASEDVVVHDALAVVSYDEKAKRYRWRAHDIRGQALDVEPKLIDGGVEWGLKIDEAGVSIRFTIKLDEKRWHEVGEASRDGKTWNQFLEMTLERQK
jgi:hypothetical protein